MRLRNNAGDLKEWAESADAGLLVRTIGSLLAHGRFSQTGKRDENLYVQLQAVKRKKKALSPLNMICRKSMREATATPRRG